MIVHTCAQRTPEWFALRCGRLTGSAAKDMLANGKGTAEAVTRRDLRYKLVAERLSGMAQEDGYKNAAMEWGIEQEAPALAAYEVATGVMVAPVGFCEMDGFQAGTSPDGLIGDDGILSIKAPKTATHLRYIREGVEPPEHVAQNTHEFWVTGRKWLDFVSFDPRLPDHLRLFTVRVHFNEDRVVAYQAKALAFLREVDLEVQALQTMRNLRGQLTASL